MKPHSLIVIVALSTLAVRSACPCNIRYEMKHLNKPPARCTQAQLDTLAGLLSSVLTFRLEIDMPLTEATLARGTCPDVEDVNTANDAWKELSPRPRDVRYTMNRYCMTDPTGVPYAIEFYLPGKVLSPGALAKLRAQLDHQQTQLIPRLVAKLASVHAVSADPPG